MKRQIFLLFFLIFLTSCTQVSEEYTSKFIEADASETLDNAVVTIIEIVDKTSIILSQQRTPEETLRAYIVALNNGDEAAAMQLTTENFRKTSGIDFENIPLFDQEGNVTCYAESGLINEGNSKINCTYSIEDYQEKYVLVMSENAWMIDSSENVKNESNLTVLIAVAEEQ